MIKNNTNNSNWKYNNSSNSNDTLLINGVNTSINDSSCSKDTNYRHIQLDKGINDFVISGANSSDISFPFVYID